MTPPPPPPGWHSPVAAATRSWRSLRAPPPPLLGPPRSAGPGRAQGTGGAGNARSGGGRGVGGRKRGQKSPPRSRPARLSPAEMRPLDARGGPGPPVPSRYPPGTSRPQMSPTPRSHQIVPNPSGGCGGNSRLPPMGMGSEHRARAGRAPGWGTGAGHRFLAPRPRTGAAHRSSPRSRARRRGRIAGPLRARAAPAAPRLGGAARALGNQNHGN